MFKTPIIENMMASIYDSAPKARYNKGRPKSAHKSGVWGTRNGAALGSRSTGFGDGREFDEIRDGSHELFSPAKIKMEGDGVSVFRSELSWNVVGNM